MTESLTFTVPADQLDSLQRVQQQADRAADDRHIFNVPVATDAELSNVRPISPEAAVLNRFSGLSDETTVVIRGRCAPHDDAVTLRRLVLEAAFVDPEIAVESDNKTYALLSAGAVRQIMRRRRDGSYLEAMQQLARDHTDDPS